MFAIFYAIGNIVSYIASGAKMTYEDWKAEKTWRQKALEGKNNCNIYVDHRGCTRDLNSNQIVDIGPDFSPSGTTGDDVLIRNKDGKILRNLSEEKRNLKVVDAKNNRKPGQTVVKYMKEYEAVKFYPKSYCDPNFIKGDRYKDLDNGRIYVIRELHAPDFITGLAEWVKREKRCIDVYMDIETKMLVRETDEERETRNELRKNNKKLMSDEDVDKLIKIVNEKRKRKDLVKNWFAYNNSIGIYKSDNSNEYKYSWISF